MRNDERRQHSEVQIRAAIERLLTGQTIHTDGTRDVTTLAAEAGVSRQDLYRSYRPLLDEFRGHLRRIEESSGASDRRAATLDRLREKLNEVDARAARYRAERDEARTERDANASRVAYLHEQNRVLLQQREGLNSVSQLRRNTQETERSP